ncbi:host-nuclease inhibitor Gam family protein [Alkalicoccus luteus]|nr:host-nuclease inhibitor Gam family protein [Alkalicoccus luteus]
MNTNTEPFQITDLGSLTWAFEKLHKIKAQEDEIKSVAKAEKDRIAEWESDELKKLENDKSYFEQLIHNYHAQQLAEDPKAKTLSTPYGKSKSRRSSQTVDKQDELELLKYVEDKPEFIKPTVKWAELKKQLHIIEQDGELKVIDQDGEIVPGVTVKPEQVNYKLEVE